MFGKNKIQETIDEFSEGEENKGIDSGRLEAFSDAVLAVVITIMVLEIHAPEGKTSQTL